MPVPTSVPPHELLNHFHEAPVPNEPPLTDNVTEVPDDTDVEDAVAAVAATLLELITRTRYCVLQPFTYV